MPTAVKLVLEDNDVVEDNDIDEENDKSEPESDSAAPSLWPALWSAGHDADGNDDAKADEEAQHPTPPLEIEGDIHSGSSKTSIWDRIASAKVWIVNNVNPKFRNYSR